MSYKPLDEGNNTNGHLGVVVAHEDGDDDTQDAPLSTSLSAFSPRRTSELSEPLNKQDDDPFYVFREDLYRQLELVDEALVEYLRIVHQTDSAANTHEVKEAKKQLKRHIKNAESTLSDVQMTVQLVESDRKKFPIDDKQLYERNTFVHISRGRINRAKADMQSESVKAKLLQDERAKVARRAGSLGARNDEQRENTAFIVDSQARQSVLMRHQDDTLDDLDVAVVRIGHMATNIHQEIGQHNKILTEMEEDFTHVEQELGLVMGKLARFLQTKDTWQLGTILCLSATVIILFFLVIYT